IRQLGDVMGGGARTVTTDDEGNFRFDHLAPRFYLLSVSEAPGYVSAESLSAEDGTATYYRVGEHVTINLVKGGVITGRVTDAGGEPLIGVEVKAIIKRDADGHPLGLRPTRPVHYTFTDDRGVYRLYGLQTGRYVVVANQPTAYAGFSSWNEENAPVYHPSSTTETATEIVVTSGGEVTGADILVLGTRGHAISGKIIGPESGSGSISFGGSVTLLNAATGAILDAATQRTDDYRSQYVLSGVPDGEYLVIATRGGYKTSPGFMSQSRGITVRGSDLAGVDLKLAPLSSVTGKITLPTVAGACEGARKPALEELVPFVLPERQEQAIENLRPLFSSGYSLADEQGEFTIHNLIPSRYRLGVKLPDESLYLASMMTMAAAAPPGSGAARPAPAAGVDVGRAGILLRPGDRLSGLVVALARGAAGIRGRIVAASEGASLPSRMRVYLVPGEAALADDPLRYAETIASGDGRFAFSNLAPGQYRLIARPVPSEEPIDRPVPQLSWNAEERAQLRREAEAATAVVELKPCQRLTDYVLRAAQR
ncbi:MAG TPA: carboxypeptidase-like regulatory domain-containing protein, partial [Blastocatellia bacterium]|nr:carboxypeptidase-like regulatory domain-containing protein [Blastocatellia bacterium]